MALVLVVDDEPDCRFMARMVLEARGHDVVEAGNGADALAAIEQQRPDVVISDLNMPVMDGLQLRAELAERLPGLPFMLWSVAHDLTSYAGKPVNGLKPKDPMALDVDALLAA